LSYEGQTEDEIYIPLRVLELKYKPTIFVDLIGSLRKHTKHSNRYELDDAAGDEVQKLIFQRKKDLSKMNSMFLRQRYSFTALYI
jgi:hypothetical protein